MEIINRIKKLAEERGISLSFLCKKMGVGRTYFVDVIKRNGTIPDNKLEIIANTLFVSAEYLKTGKKKKFQIAFSDVFNQDYTLTRYAYYVWEALNDLTSALELFFELDADTTSFRGLADSIIAFKYCVIVLDEAAKIVFLTDDTRAAYEDVRNNLLVDAEIKEDFELASNFWKEKRTFFDAIRNYSAHFDHERKKHLSSFIESTENYTFYKYEDFLCDYDNPIYLAIIESIYKDIHSCTNVDLKAIGNDMIELSKPVRRLLSEMFYYFFENYTYFNDTEQKYYLKNEKRQILKRYIPIKKEKADLPEHGQVDYLLGNESNMADLPEQDKKMLDMLHSLDAEGKEKAEQYLELLSLQYGKSSVEDEIDELISALPDKNDDTVTMKIAAFGGGVREVKVSKVDLKELVNMIEEEEN